MARIYLCVSILFGLLCQLKTSTLNNSRIPWDDVTTSSAGCESLSTVAIDHMTDSCGQSYLCSPGTLKSPHHPSLYPNSMDCRWTISTTNEQKILLQFSIFSLEKHPSCAWDYLDVYDGDSKHAPRRGRFCGDKFPKTLVSSGSKLLLIFHADNNIRAPGFVMNFSSIPAISSTVVLPTQSSAVNPKVWGTSDSRVPVNKVSTTFLSYVVSTTLSLDEISSRLVAFPTKTSVGSSIVWGTNDLHILQGDKITTRVKNMSTRALSDAISTTTPLTPSSKLIEINTWSTPSALTTLSKERRTEISSRLLALPTKASADSSLVWGTSDSHILHWDMITTPVKNMPTTALSDTISTTLSLEPSTKRVEIDTSSKPSVLNTLSMARQTDISSSMVSPTQPSTVSSVVVRTNYSHMLPGDAITTHVNNMSTTVLPGVISTTSPVTPSSKQIEVIITPKKTVFRATTDISSSMVSSTQPSTVNTAVLRTNSSHIQPGDAITTHVNTMSPTVLPDVISTTFPEKQSSKQIEINITPKQTVFRTTTEISSRLVALPTKPSAGSSVLRETDDSHVLQGDMITTHAKNMSTTAMSDAISTTLPPTPSSKRIEIDTSSSHSVLKTFSMERTTDISSSMVSPTQPSTVNTVVLRTNSSQIQPGDAITTHVNNMSTWVLSGVILTTLPVTPTSKQNEVIISPKQTVFRATTEISSGLVALPTKPSAGSSILRGTNDSHILQKDMITTPVKNVSTTTLSDAIPTTLPTTPSSKNQYLVEINTSSRPSGIKTLSIERTTEITQTVVLPTRSSVVNPVASRTKSSHTPPGEVTKVSVNGMSNVVSADVISSTLSVTQSSKHIEINATSRPSVLGIPPFATDRATEIVLNTQSSSVHTEEIATTSAIDISTTAMNTVISATLHVTPSSKYTKLNTTSRPFVNSTISTSTSGSCPEEEVGSPEAYGIFLWPKTSPGKISSAECPYNNESFASRECRFYTNEKDSKIAWGPAIVTNCIFQDAQSKDIFLLSEKEVNATNVVRIAQKLNNLSVVNQDSTLNAGDIENIATILENIAAVKEKANEVLDDFVATIDNVLDSKIENILKAQGKGESSSRIVKTLNNFADSLVVGPEGKLEAVKRNFDINLQTVPVQNFAGLNFSGASGESDRKNETNGILPSLLIPQRIFNDATLKISAANQTVLFVLYKETKFFRLSLDDTRRMSSRLNSLVISGRIKGLSVQNLSVPVRIALPSIEKGDTNSTLCSYWNFTIGTGNWSQEGCKFERVLEDERVLCSCNHFTNFAMLMDVYPGERTVNDRILGIVSYVGCALSLIGLVCTIITILILRQLRTQVPSQILLNFCIALSLTILVFLAAAEESKTSSFGGCRAAAIALHYFLLAAFFWMAVEAYNMYRAFVIIFTDFHPSKFLMKCCLFAWGTPGVIVAITMIIALEKYGDKTYCRLHGVPFIVAFLTPTILILVVNIVAFCFIIRSLLTSGNKVTSDRKKTGFLQAKRGIAIMVLLGLTWLFGVLAIGDAKVAFQYLFCIFNTLQGLFVFFFFVVLPSRTRRQLQKLGKEKYSKRSQVKRNNINGASSHFNSKGYSSENNTYSTGMSESKVSENTRFNKPAIEASININVESDERSYINSELDQIPEEVRSTLAGYV